MSRRSNLRHVFGRPALLAVVSSIGLVAALLVEGPADAVWTLAIGAPLAVVVMKLATRRD